LDLHTVSKSLFCEHNMQASVRNVVSTAEESVPKLGAQHLPCQVDLYALRHAPELQIGSSHLTCVGVQHLHVYLCHTLHKTGYTCSCHCSM